MKKYIKFSYDKRLVDLYEEIKDNLIGITANTVDDVCDKVRSKLRKMSKVASIESIFPSFDDIDGDDVIWVIIAIDKNIDYEMLQSNDDVDPYGNRIPVVHKIGKEIEFCVMIDGTDSTYIVDDVDFDV